MNYSYDETLAPKGKSVMAVYYMADYDYWNALDQKETNACESGRGFAVAVCAFSLCGDGAAGAFALFLSAGS